jgi:hypothetical protein
MSKATYLGINLMRGFSEEPTSFTMKKEGGGNLMFFIPLNLDYATLTDSLAKSTPT